MIIVQKWVKEPGEAIERSRPQTGEVEPVSVMELDEMWHFVQKRTNAGSGQLMTGTGGVRALFSLDKEIPERLRGHGDNSRCLIPGMSARIIIPPVAGLFRTVCMLRPNPERPRLRGRTAVFDIIPHASAVKLSAIQKPDT